MKERSAKRKSSAVPPAREPAGGAVARAAPPGAAAAQPSKPAPPSDLASAPPAEDAPADVAGPTPEIASGPSRRWLGLAAIGVFLVVFLSVALTAGDLGLTWDEPAYRHSARGNPPQPSSRDSAEPTDDPIARRHERCGMLRWFHDLIHAENWDAARAQVSQQTILEAWDYNRFGPNFHPPLSGMLACLGYLATGWFIDEIAAWRLASGAEFALAAAMLFLFLARRYGPWVGGVAAASLALMPRVFGDAHIFGTDMPMMAVWALTALAFWNGLDSRLWRLIFGMLLGLCFVTKFSAMLVIVPLVAWLVAYRVVPGFSARRLVSALVATALVGGPLAVAGFEVVRLAGAIRHHTQQERMLAPVFGAMTHKTLDQFFSRSAPYSDDDLKVCAETLLNEMARQLAGSTLEGLVGHGPKFTTRELKRVAEQLNVDAARELVLDDFISRVDVRELGVQSPVPGWVLLLPLPIWLTWSLVGSLRLAPEFVRESGGGLRVWLAGLAIAPAVAVALNPTWWHETLPQLAHYYQISAGRQGALPDIEIFYLGKKYVYSLPWHNGWVLTAVTVPMAIVGLALVGLGTAAWHWRRDPLRMFFVLNMLTLPLLRMLPWTPAHDGVRLMLPTFFFLAGLAGWTFELIERAVERFRSEEYSTAPVLGVMAGLLLLPPLYWAVRAHPYELSYYNGLVGGLAGAQRLGFEPTYWYDAVTPEVRRQLNDSERGLPHGAALHPPDSRNAVPVFEELQELGRLRSDIRLGDVGPDEFPHMFLLTHSSKASPFTRLMFALKPRYSSDASGVRLFSVYDPPAVARAFALTLFLNDAPDRRDFPPRPRVNSFILTQARENPRAIVDATVLLSEFEPEEALERARRERPDAAEVIEWLARKQADLRLLLARHKPALVEAAEIVVRTAEKRPGHLERLIEYEGYLAPDQLGAYLDEGLAPAQ